MTAGRRPERLVRSYVVTDGRAHPSRNVLELDTLVGGHVGQRLPGASPEKLALLELCSHGALSVVEIAAHLALPVGVTKVLLSDLIDSGHLKIIPKAQLPTKKTLEDVLRGLRSLQV